MKTEKCVTVEKELKNVAPKFKKAIWKEYFPGECFTSVRKAAKHYNLKNCRYTIVTDTIKGMTYRLVNNAKIDGYGRRYN